MQSAQLPLDADDARLARLQSDTFTRDNGREVVVCIDNLSKEPERTRFTVLIPDLRLDMNRSFVVGNVEIGGIDIGAGSTEIAVERQCLIELARHMQPYVLRDAAIVGIEIAIVPLVTALILTRLVGPAVVTAHGQHVVTFLDIWCQVEAAGHHAVLTEAEMHSVQIEVCPLSHALELDKIFMRIFNPEMLPIPADGVRQIDDVLTESLIAVKGVWQCDLLPTAVIEIWCRCGLTITHLQPPAAVEVQLLTLNRLLRLQGQVPQNCRTK